MKLTRSRNKGKNSYVGWYVGTKKLLNFIKPTEYKTFIVYNPLVTYLTNP